MGRQRSWVAAVAISGVLVGSIAGCSGSDDAELGAGGSTTTGAPHEPGGGWDCGPDCDWDSAASGGADGSKASGRALADSEESLVADEAPTGAPTTTVPLSTVPGEPTPDAPDRPVVTAGSIDDNQAWEDYLLYRQWFDALAPRPEVLDLRVEGRQVLTVVDASGHPVPGAAISVVDGAGEEVARLTTYADGRALFHPPTDEIDPRTQSRPVFEAVVSPPSWAGGGEPVRQRLTADTSSYTVDLGELTVPEGVRLDVAFLLDATGSMGDEIDRLKANMVSIAEQIDALPGDPDVRFAMTVYRDQGDLFVTRTFDFTGDVATFTAGLRDVTADGGGDWPEALEDGLHDVLTAPTWRGDDTVKLVFLVADAPPHVGGEGPNYTDDLRAAAAAGVKVFPIASSGLADDPQGEYIFRQLAQATLARFVFLTYGADGTSPGDSTAHHVEPDAYSVLPLDELVVKLVTDELAPLNR